MQPSIIVVSLILDCLAPAVEKGKEGEKRRGEKEGEKERKQGGGGKGEERKKGKGGRTRKSEEVRERKEENEGVTT